MHGRRRTLLTIIVATLSGFGAGWLAFADAGPFAGPDSAREIARKVAAREHLTHVTCDRDDSTGAFDCSGSSVDGCHRAVGYKDGAIVRAAPAPRRRGRAALLERAALREAGLLETGCEP